MLKISSNNFVQHGYLAKAGLDGRAICSKSLINFSSGRHSNNRLQLLPSTKYFQSASVMGGWNSNTQPSQIPGPLAVTSIKCSFVRNKIVACLSIIIFISSCGSSNNSSVSATKDELINVKLIEIKRFNSVNQIQSVSEKSDTLFLISPGKREYEIDTSKFIALRLTRITNFRVGTMEQLGAYMITGNDTLWSGPSTKNAPKFYRIIEQ